MRPDADLDQRDGFATTEGRSERDQAYWWVRATATFLAVPRVEHIAVYEIKDLRSDEPVIGDAPNYHLGLTRVDRTPKSRLIPSTPAPRRATHFSDLVGNLMRRARL